MTDDRRSSAPRRTEEEMQAATVGELQRPRHADPPRRLRPGLAGPVRAGGGPDPVDPGRSGRPARARRLDVGARARGQADHRHRPGRPGLRRTSRPTSRTWRRPATCSSSASRTGTSTASSRARTRTSTCTCSPTGCREIDRMVGVPRLAPDPRRGPRPVRADQARPGGPRMALRPALRRREDRGRRGDHRPGEPPTDRRGMMCAGPTPVSRTGRTDAQPGPAEAADRADRERACGPPAVLGHLGVLPAREPRRLGQALPRPVDRGSPARPADHGFPDRQRDRVRPAGPQGDIHPVRLGRELPPSAPWSPSGPSPPSSTRWRPSRQRTTITAATSSSSGSSRSRSRKRRSSRRSSTSSTAASTCSRRRPFSARSSRRDPDPASRHRRSPARLTLACSLGTVSGHT